MSSVPGPRSEYTDKQLAHEPELHCKLVIWLWLIGGGIYVICTGRILSLPPLLLFFPGIFVACRIAWIGFNVYVNLVSWVDALEARGSRAAWLACGCGLLWWVGAMLVGPIYLAVLYVRLIRGIFYQP